MILEATTLSSALLLKFALGYFVILATPGPNMLTIGTMAALRGFRGALPFCLGIALGAGLVAGATSLLLEAFAGSHKLELVGRIVAGTLLMVLAFHIICARAPRVSDQTLFSQPRMPHNWCVGLGTGFFIALTNPVTAAYCFAQFMGPLAQTGAATLGDPCGCHAGAAFWAADGGIIRASLDAADGVHLSPAGLRHFRSGIA